MRMRKPLFMAGAGLVALVALCAKPAESWQGVSLLREFSAIGGAGNNEATPELDARPGAPQRHLAPLRFAPGSDNALVDAPNARTLSNVIAGGAGAQGQNAESTDPRATAWLYVFGQFVDHDLDLELSLPGGPAIDISVPPGDPLFPSGSTIAVQRDVRDPRTNTIVNLVTGYLDLSTVYGSSPGTEALVRGADGLMATSEGGQYPPVVGEQFVLGDVRGMENPELTATTTLFLREHNWWARGLRSTHPDWTADQVYEMARAITTAEYQNIVYNEFLPLLIGPVLGPYHGYDPSVSTQVSQEFSAAAFRVGHSQVSEEQTGVDNSGREVFTQPLAQAFFNTAQQDIATGFDPLLRNLSLEASQATDVFVVPTLRNMLFAPIAGGQADQVDLVAIDIQRGRDAGLNTLNATRQALGLAPYNSFADLTPDPVLQQKFESLYGSIDQVELFIGGLAEAHAPDATVGPTFQAIIKEQFDKLRTGDRYFWRNQGFDDALAQSIATTRLSDILRRNADSPALPDDVFVLAEDPPPVHHDTGTSPFATVDSHGRKGVPFVMP